MGLGSDTARQMIRLDFLTGNGSVRTALSRVRAALTEAELGIVMAEIIELVLAEIFNNIEEHAYCGVPGGPVAVSIIPCETSVAIEVSDAGICLPGGIAGRGDLPDLRAHRGADLPEGGWGWALIHALTESLEYQRHKGKNVLRLRIVRP